VEQPETVVAADVEREIVVDATADVVFAHFTDPERMCHWMGVDAELDPRPGGTFRVNVNGRDVARGEYVEVVPNSRVVFTWGWEGPDHPVPPGSSTVEITLTPRGGRTVVRLRHTGLPAAMRAIHGEGWAHYLARLATVLEGGDPGPDPQAKPADQ
jgi:uncharacterized protein YndB with AHSA1/START domain